MRASSSTVLDLLDVSASVIHTSGGAVPARDLADQGRRVAERWERDGLRAGDRVAVYADNGLPYLRCIAAAAAGRFVLVSVNRRYSGEEARTLVERSGSSVVVTDAGAVFPTPGDEGPEVISIESVVAPDSGIENVDVGRDRRPDPSDPFVVFTTSGTTSRPKMVLHDQRSIALHATDAARRFGYTDDDRVLVALPLCGVFGFDSLTAALAADSQVWLPDRFEAKAAARLVESERITAMNGSDDMFHRMLLGDHDLSSIRVGGYGRFNSSLDGVVGRAEARGVTLTGLYGMSEVQALFALRDPDEDIPGRERAGGALASADAAFRIVDPDTLEPVADDEGGELIVAGPSLFTGYLAEGGDAVDADLTSGAHHELEGRRWFRTGDLARAEADGTFTFSTRMGDVLRLGGFLVNPAEIEAVVLELDGVREAAAVALPRPEGVRAAIVVIADHDPDPAAVIAHCRARLARYKVPVAVVRVDEFPTTPSANGTKIRVGELRSITEAALAAEATGTDG